MLFTFLKIGHAVDSLHSSIIFILYNYALYFLCNTNKA